MTELGVARLAASRTFRCGRSGSGVTKPEGFVVSRPRASCDAGLLIAAICFACLSHPCGCSKLARSSSSHLAMLRRLSDDCASSLTDGHAPCSSLDAHVVLAFSVPAPALVFRRSRPPPLRGLFRRPPPAFATDVPRLSPSAFTTKSSWSSTPSVSAVLASRRSRATLHRLTVHGLANSCHVSTRAGGDPLPFEDRARTSHPAIAPALAFRRWRLPGRRPRDPCPALRRFMSRSRRTMILSNHRCACIHLSFGTGSRCYRIDLHLSTLTTRRHFRAHVRATCP